MNDNNKIKLSFSDLAFILENTDVSEKLREKLLKTKVKLSASDADDLREFCADTLQVEGFDEDYEPNKLGKKLEDLMEKLFVG